MLNHHHLEQLECRCLLSLSPFANEVSVPAFGAVIDTDVAVAGEGSYIVATSSRDEAVNTISFVRYAANGLRTTNATELFSYSSQGGAPQLTVSAAIDNDGDAVVAFRTAESGGVSSVYFVRVSKTNVVSAPVLLQTVTQPDQDSLTEVIAPAVSMGRNGSFFVGWLHTISSDDHETRFRAFDAAGSPRASEIIIGHDSGISTQAKDLDIDAAADGNSAAFAYTISGGDFSESNVHFGRISTTGLIGQEQFVNNVTDEPSNTYRPSVASHADGSFVLAYGQLTGFSSGEVFDEATFVERYDGAGNQLGSDIQLLSPVGATGLAPVIDTLADGGFVVSFTGSNASAAYLFAQRFSALGISDDDGPVDVDSMPAGEFNRFNNLSIAADAYGSLVVGYTEANDTTARFRRLTTQIAIVDHSILYVLGTRRSDVISVKPAVSGTIIVQRGATIKKFAGPPGYDGLSIEGFNGNDRLFNGINFFSTIRGGSGNDTINGFLQADILRGHAGNDFIYGGSGGDRIIGDDGLDSLFGNEGRDTIDGGRGDDRIYGYGGNDHIFGGDGNDRILGGASNDSLVGDAGNDYLNGESGADIQRGGAGNDLLIAADGVVDRLFGDDGSDSSVADEIDQLSSIESAR